MPTKVRFQAHWCAGIAMAVMVPAPALAQLDELIGSPRGTVQASAAERAAAGAARAEAVAALEEVVVTGERPGPALWQVRRGDHVLWILGTVNWLPKDVTWNTRELEQLMTRVQLVIPERADVNIGVTSMLLHVRTLAGAVMLPEGKKLAQVLSAESVARFERLRMQHAPRDQRLDSMRPLAALLGIRNKAAENMGLKGVNIQRSVLEMARRHHIKVARINGPEIFYGDVKGAIIEVHAIPPEIEQRCFDLGLADFEFDLSVGKARATAWATGNVDALRKLADSARGEACMQDYLRQAESRNPAAFAQLEAKSRQLTDAWMQTAQNSLNQYAASLTMKPIDTLVGKDGLLQQFALTGAVVTEPEAR